MHKKFQLALDAEASSFSLEPSFIGLRKVPRCDVSKKGLGRLSSVAVPQHLGKQSNEAGTLGQKDCFHGSTATATRPVEANRGQASDEGRSGER